MRNSSIIVTQVAKILMPFIIVFGIYVVIGGADSVGGGFQGGAIFSAVFMLRYMTHPSSSIETKFLRHVEKVLMVAFLLLAVFFLGSSMDMGEKWGEIWMIFLNFIIAIKVCCGLGIIFFRYVFYEGQ